MTGFVVALCAFCFCLGVLAGITGYRFYLHRPRGRHMTEKETGVLAFVRRHSVLFVAVSVALDILLTLGFGLILNQYVHLTDHLSASDHRQQAQADCQAQVNGQLLKVLHARADASRGAILAPQPFFHALLPALTSPDATEAQRKAMVDELVKANKRANRAYVAYVVSQAAHPIPPLPDCKQESE